MTSLYPSNAKPLSYKEIPSLRDAANKNAANKSIKMLKFLNEEALKAITDRQCTSENANIVLNKLITFQKSPLSRDKKELPAKIVMNGSWSINKPNQEHCSSNQETAETMKMSCKVVSIHHKYIARNTSLIKNRKLLLMLNVSTKECKQCQQGSLKIIANRLKEKYFPSRDLYNVKVMNDIIFNENTHLVSIFKDYLIYDDMSEFLRRYYKLPELKQRLPKIFDYYSKSAKVYPDYVLIPERKFINKNIEKKKKYISDIKKSPKHRIAEVQEDNKIFTTQFLGELNKPGSTIEPSISQVPIDSLLTSYIKNSKPLERVNQINAHLLFEQELLKDSFSLDTNKEEALGDPTHQRTKSSLSKCKNTYKEMVHQYNIKGKQANLKKTIANNQICNIQKLINQNMLKQLSSPKSKIFREMPIKTEKSVNSIKKGKQNAFLNINIKSSIRTTSNVQTSRAKSAQRGSHIGIEGILKDFEKDIKMCRPTTQLKHKEPIISTARQYASKKKLKLDVESINKLSLKLLSKVGKISSKTPDPLKIKIKGDFPFTTKCTTGITHPFSKEKKAGNNV